MSRKKIEAMVKVTGRAVRLKHLGLLEMDGTDLETWIRSAVPEMEKPDYPMIDGSEGENFLVGGWEVIAARSLPITALHWSR